MYDNDTDIHTVYDKVVCERLKTVCDKVVCERLCHVDKDAEAKEEEPMAGYRTKTKNPTQRCVEQCAENVQSIVPFCLPLSGVGQTKQFFM